MKLKRLTAGIMASFDWVISQVENHDALVQAAIKEGQQAAARAKVQLSRVRKDGKRMRTRKMELDQAIEQWTERAVKLAKEDEKKALECLRRKKRAEQERATLEEQIVEHSKHEDQLNGDLAQLHERLERLKTQRNMMRTRQSRAEAISVIKADDSQLLSEIDDIFERWETQVTEYEIQSSCQLDQYDDFEDEFIEEENLTELQAELEELTR